MPGGNRSSSQAMRSEFRGWSITSTIPVPPHRKTCLWKYLIPDHHQTGPQHGILLWSPHTNTCHSPQDHKKRKYLPHPPEGIGTVGSRDSGWGQNIVHQWTTRVHHKRIPHVARGHQEAVEAHLKSPKLHVKFYRESQGVNKLTLCAFHWIFTPLPWTKDYHLLNYLVQSRGARSDQKATKCGHRMDNHPPNEAFLPRGIQSTGWICANTEQPLYAKSLDLSRISAPRPIYRWLPACSWEKRKLDREDKHMEDSQFNNKAKPKVEINDLLRKHFTNGIWKVNLSLRFRDLASFWYVHTFALSKENKVCTLGMFQSCSRPYCKKTYHKATYEEAKHMFNIMDKTIKNPDQVQAVSAGEKSN